MRNKYYQMYNNLPEKKGIYAIQNLENGMIYIGFTQRKGGVKDRVKKHFESLFYSSHHNPLMIEDFKKNKTNWYAKLLIETDDPNLEYLVINECIRLGHGIYNLYRLNDDGIPTKYKQPVPRKRSLYSASKLWQ